MVKTILKWVIPLLYVGIMVIPSLGGNAILRDPLSRLSQPPSSSSLRSNRYTQMETDDRLVAHNDFADLEGYTYRATFGHLSFYDQTSDASFRIVDERSGYLWSSSINYDYFLEEDSPLADPDDIGLNLFWQSKLRSPFFLTYYNGLNVREEHAFENFRSRLTATRFTTSESVGMTVAVSLFLSKINFTFTVTFDQDGLAVSLPMDTVEETEDFKLSSISFYPLLGATKRLRTPGYVVIPDGVGALIRYNDDPHMGVFTKRFFGGDLGLNQFRSEQPLFANMYGIVHGHRQHAMLAVVADGAGHAILTHYGSQVFLDLNFTYVTFNYRNTYIQYLNQAKTSSVALLQSTPNQIDASMRYQFLTGVEADYVGIANEYADQYVDREPLLPTHDTIPLHLDVLALETKPGLFARQPVVMTDMQALASILTDVQTTITPHLNVAYLGWQQGGYSYTAPIANRFSHLVGLSSQWQTLVNAQPEATQLYLAADPFRAYRQGTGYRQAEIMQTIGQEFIYQGDYYHLQFEAGATNLSDVTNFANQLDTALAIETIGSFASSHFGRLARNKDQFIKGMETLLLNHRDSALYQPFSYGWQVRTLFDMPMYSSQQAKFSDTVPLIAIMLMGRRHAFGRAGNFFANTTNELLRMIDYGYYPAFFLTEASAYQLLETPSEHIFTSRYQDWAPEMKRQYEFIAGALNASYGQTLTSRTVVALGVIANTYAHGTTIYINYSGQDVIVDGQTIPAMGYEVIHAG